MKYGIYDKFKTFSTESQLNVVKDFFKSYQFNSRVDAETKATELGLDLVDILGLNFNGKSSTSNFQEWRQELLKSTYQEVARTQVMSRSIEKISGDMVNLVKSCIEQKGVHAYIIPSNDNQNFSVTVDFVPHSSSKSTTKGEFTITPSSVSATCMPRDYIGKKDLEIGPQGVSVSCRRSPTETVNVTVNTDEGSPVLYYDAYVVPKPNINFNADNETIESGKSTILRWDVTNASSVELEGYGAMSASGTKTVSPTSTKEYQLIVTGLNGARESKYKTVTVLPPPPVLSGAKVYFHTTDNDKDHDTHVSVYVICGGNTIASTGGTWGKFNDNSDAGPFGLTVTEALRKDQIIGSCSARLVEAPKGHDEWHFNWALILTFSNGTEKRYDWGGGNVDYNRTTITQPL
jgi:hypothetical protein